MPLAPIRFSRWCRTAQVAVTMFASGIGLAANPLGFDMGWSPERTEATVSVLGDAESLGTWLRVRGMVASEVRQGDDGEPQLPWPNATVGSTLAERRDALTQLRNSGHEIVAMLRWPVASWQSGTRSPRSQLPLDLTEAYERCRDLARTYGDLVTAWEIENEPDISFVPENAETFAAFHKACALGIIHGRAANAAERSKGLNLKRLNVGENEPPRSDQQDIGKADGDDLQTFRPSDFKTTHDPASSAIMHSPLALPPGPYWDQLVANGILAYTEAFNYHYYGFPEDFRGVRDWWISALNEAFDQRGRQKSQGLTSKSQVERNAGPGNAELPLGPTAPDVERQDPSSEPSHPATPPDRLTGQSPPGERAHPQTRPSDLRPSDFKTPLETPALPLFLTEYGYGPLDRFDRFSVEGRELQKRFFEITLPSITDGSIMGAMAFVFMPYYEQGRSEFGLLAEIPAGFSPGAERLNGQRLPAPAPTTSADPTLGPSDLKPRSSSPDVPKRDPASLSPVVMDFIARSQLLSVKRYNGHLLQHWAATAVDIPAPPQARIQPDATTQLPESAPLESSGDFDLVLYNFSDQPVSGTLRLALETGLVRDRAPAVPVETARTTAPEPKTTTAPKPPRSAPPPPPPPYQRPEFPRSSVRPPADADWPTPETPSFTAKDGRDYLISPALQLLMDASMKREQTTASGVPQSGHAVDRHDLRANAHDRASENSTTDPSSPASPLEKHLTLVPNSRQVIPLTGILPVRALKPNRLQVTWRPASPETTPGQGTSKVHESSSAPALLETQLYPPTNAFGAQLQSAFAFMPQKNAEARERQLSRKRAEGEAPLSPNPTSERWLSTRGVEVEETLTGWMITINDVPDVPLRPAELELPLPEDWVFPPEAGLSFSYRIRYDVTEHGTDPDAKIDPATAPNRIEEVEIALRDTEGTDFGVWPRLFATKDWQPYLEFPRNFTPMFFSRATSFGPFSERKWAALVIKVHTRTLPTVLEIQLPSFMLTLPK